MPFHAQKLIDLTRRYLREESPPAVSGNQWTDPQLLNYIQESIDLLVDDLVEADEDFFVSSETYDFLAATAFFDLPPGFIRVRKLEYIAGGTKIPILESRANEDDESGIGVSLTPATGNQFTYALVDDQINLDPVPAGALTQAMLLWYVRKPPDLVYGRCPASGSANTIRLQLSDNDDGVAADILDNAYNGCWIVTTGGVGAGQRRRIADYTGSTGTATLGVNWGVTPDTTTTYALESKIPAPAERLPALMGAIAALNDIDESSARLEDRANALHDRLITSAEQRTQAERVTQPWDPEDGTWPVSMG